MIFSRGPSLAENAIKLHFFIIFFLIFRYHGNGKIKMSQKQLGVIILVTALGTRTDKTVKSNWVPILWSINGSYPYIFICICIMLGQRAKEKKKNGPTLLTTHYSPKRLLNIANAFWLYSQFSLCTLSFSSSYLINSFIFMYV